jgi:PASTA domain
MVGEIHRRLLIAVGLAACAAAMFASSAQANTVVVGSSLTAQNFVPISFSAPATVTNYVLPAPATASSPVDGTVISWSFIGDGGPLIPRVLRSTGTTSLSAAGTGAAQSATVPPNGVSGPFSTVIPIKKGDYFGVDGESPAALSTASLDGVTSLYFEPALVDGSGEQAPVGTNPQEDAISAVVRYCLVPKLKGKTGKAARQALHAADCTVGTVTKGKKSRPQKSVLKQSVKAGTSISDTVPVALTISRTKKS